MSWHRLVRVHKSKNVLIHYTLEGYDNAGVTSTLTKDGDYLILDFTTTDSASYFYDRAVEAVLKEVLGEENS